MFQLLLLLITAAVAYASTGCSFGLAVSGGISGPVWQLQNGQLRVGDYHTAAKFQIGNDYVIDSNGSGCILTPMVRQFQCNEGESALQGFSIEENSVLLYNNNPKFYACPASETEWNIYSVPVARQNKCVAIKINADNCSASKQRVLGHRSMPGFFSNPPPEFIDRYREVYGVEPPEVDSGGPSSGRSPKKFRLPKFDGSEFSIPDADQRSGYYFRDPTPPPSKSLLEKLGLPKFDLSNFFGQAASVPKASPPAKHHPIAKAAALIVPNMIGGVVGGMLANALPSLLPKNRHHDNKEGEEAGIDEPKTKLDKAVKTIAPAYSASKETVGPELKDTKADGETSKLAQSSMNIIPRSFRDFTTTLSPIAANTVTVAASVTTTATASSGFKTEFRTLGALGSTTSL